VTTGTAGHVPVPIDGTVPSLIPAESATVSPNFFRSFWNEAKAWSGFVFRILYLCVPDSAAAMMDRSHLEFLNHGIAGNDFHAGLSTMNLLWLSFIVTIVII
jgi:hypothetical protein